MILHFALALSMLAPPTSEAPRPTKAAAQKAFNDGEWQTALELYLNLAEAPGVHAPNALVGAHDSLRALHQNAPSDASAYLCRALDLARAVLLRDDLTDSDRAFWRELEADDSKLASATCAADEPPPAKPPPSEPQGGCSPGGGRRDGGARCGDTRGASARARREGHPPAAAGLTDRQRFDLHRCGRGPAGRDDRRPRAPRSGRREDRGHRPAETG